MIDNEFLATPFEVKFTQGGVEGTFEGYGSVFGNQDSHGDVVLPGAFAASLADRKAQGRGIPMHVMHGVFGGDGVPVGVWTDASEDSKGLHLKGKLSGMNTDLGRMRFELVKDGALGGLSIGFTVPDGGAIRGKNAGEPRRQLKAVQLHEVSLVDDPSNALARVTELKRRLAPAELRAVAMPGKAIEAITAAITLHHAALKGGDAPTAQERADLLAHMQDVHEALTGAPLVIEGKASTTAAALSALAAELRRALAPSPFSGFTLPDLRGASGMTA